MVVAFHFQAADKAYGVEQVFEDDQPGIERKLLVTYVMPEHDDARCAPEQLQRGLDRTSALADGKQGQRNVLMTEGWNSQRSSGRLAWMP